MNSEIIMTLSEEIDDQSLPQATITILRMAAATAPSAALDTAHQALSNIILHTTSLMHRLQTTDTRRNMEVDLTHHLTTATLETTILLIIGGSEKTEPEADATETMTTITETEEMTTTITAVTTMIARAILDQNVPETITSSVTRQSPWWTSLEEIFRWRKGRKLQKRQIALD